MQSKFRNPIDKAALKSIAYITSTPSLSFYWPMPVKGDHLKRPQITSRPPQHHAKWFEQFTTTQMGGIQSFDVYRSQSLLNRALLAAGMFSSVAARGHVHVKQA